MIENWTSTLLKTHRIQRRNLWLRSIGATLTLLSAVSIGATAITQTQPAPDPSLFALILAGKEAEAHQVIARDPQAALTVDPDGNTPLHLAAITGQKDLVRFLLSQGLSPNALNHHGETPLLFGLRACRNELAIVDCLLAAGADPQKNVAIEDEQSLIADD